METLSCVCILEAMDKTVSAASAIRQKWVTSAFDLKMNGLVLASSEHPQGVKQHLGIVTECERVKDGSIRIASVRTTEGPLRRDMRKFTSVGRNRVGGRAMCRRTVVSPLHRTDREHVGELL